MMKQKTENKFRVARQLVVLPLLALLVMGLSNKEVKTEFVQPTTKVEVIVDGKGFPSDDENLAKVDGQNSDRTISGKVTNVNGNPVPGVSVVIKGTSTGTTSDNSGNFKIKVDNEDATLVFSGKIFVDQEIEVKNKTQINVVLKYNITGEILYGDQKNIPEKTYKFMAKGKVTDSDGNPVGGVTVLLKGKTAGTITNNQGSFAIGIEEESEILSFNMIGFEPKEVIVENEDALIVSLAIDPDYESNNTEISEGMNSQNGIEEIKNFDVEFFSKIDNPVLIIDGKIVKDSMPIDKKDIASMTVLKSATARNIYGDIGKNGAYIITTKKAASKSNENVRNNETIQYKTNEGIIPPDYRLPTEVEWKNAATKVNRIISGKITDNDGYPIVLANVVQYNKPGGRAITGTITDINGAFVIKLATNNETLHFSKTGYQSKEVNVEGKEEINVALEKVSNTSNEKSGYSISGDLKGAVSPDGNMKIASSTNEGLNVRIRQNGDSKDQPLILVNGAPYNYKADRDFDFATANIEEFGELINVAPENIESIEVLKDAASMAIYGNKAKNGVLLIKTKRKEGAINSIQELRNFMAREIRFPVDAQDELNDQLSMRFYVRVNNKGEITDIGENIGGGGEIFPVDEIVVTALRPKNVVKESDIKNGNLMAKEAERVLNKLPDIEIPGVKGKILEIWFKFVLQDQ